MAPLIGLTAERGFESAKDLEASQILAPEEMRGEHHEVDARAQSDGFLNYYTIRSDYGAFEAGSTAMLRGRIREIHAMAELDELSKTEVFAKAAADAGMRQVRTVKAFATKPVATAKGIPAGIGRMFGRYKRQAGDAVDATREYVANDDKENTEGGDNDDDSSAAKDLTRSYFGVGKAERAWSKKLGTDPYTSNEVLRGAIKEVAWAERLGNVGMGFAGIPKIPGASIIGDVNEAVWSKDPYELRDMNLGRLMATGADEALIAAYLDNTRMTPTQQTLLTATIAELADVAGRDGILRQALRAETEEEIQFLIRSATMLAWYHLNRKPVVLLNSDEVLPVGQTADGTMVVAVAADHLYWTEEIARASADFARIGDSTARREAWFLRSVSDRSRTELQRLGFDVHEDTAAMVADGTSADESTS